MVSLYPASPPTIFLSCDRPGGGGGLKGGTYIENISDPIFHAKEHDPLLQPIAHDRFHADMSLQT